ncbi:response regulator [Paenibacillus sp. FSL H8-0537]|uniref:response regulator n=1 Tax=Paenibacillus sp. FSL H8-0537 TaxID=2921399 RepID=UPI003100B2FE
MIELLLVDDEAYVTLSLEKTIPWDELGVSKVYRAESAAEALAIMEAGDIDILVTDIRMPGMDGLQLIEQAKKLWPDLRCILMTGYSDFQYAKKALQLQASDYILKPVDDKEFVRSLMNTIEELKVEWEQAEQYHQLVYNMKSEYGLLRRNLLHDLLLGRQLSDTTIGSKLAQYEIPLRLDAPSVILLIQYSNPYDESNRSSMELMEYAVGNIGEEVFAEHMNVWYGKAPHNCLIFVAQPNEEQQRLLEFSPDYKGQLRAMLEQAVDVFRRQISHFLRSEVSLIISDWFSFPSGMANAYRTGMSVYLSSAIHESGIAVYLENHQAEPETRVNLMEALYKPPTLIHLLESKQWDTALLKIDEVFGNLEQVKFSREHLYEVFLSITNAFMYTAHKQGQFIYEIDHAGFDMLLDHTVIHSLDKLRNWSTDMLERLRTELSSTEEYAKSSLVKQVQELVSASLGHDTSVKTIADKVFLHPVYLSKIYKAQTGESISDYITRMRMERAHYLLKQTNKKIYEITSELGYQNPQYFSKIFRKHYGMTPQEFRDQ